METLTIFYHAISSVIALFLLTKLMGCRQVSQFSMFDYVNGITIGSIAAEMAIDLEGNFLNCLTAMVVYAGFILVLTRLSQSSVPLRRLINGKAITLYKNGTLYSQNLKKARMDIDEFLAECRIMGYFDLSQIDTAILEPNGKISFLPVTEDRPATPKDLGISPQQEELFANVIIDGQIQHYNLKHLGRDENWLRQKLKSQNVKRIEDVFLAISDRHDHFQVFPRLSKIIDQDMLG